MEQEEYTKEEIDWSYIDFVDNQDILDLIEKVCSVWFIIMFSLASPKFLSFGLFITSFYLNSLDGCQMTVWIGYFKSRNLREYL